MSTVERRKSSTGISERFTGSTAVAVHLFIEEETRGGGMLKTKGSAMERQKVYLFLGCFRKKPPTNGNLKSREETEARKEENKKIARQNTPSTPQATLHYSLLSLHQSFSQTGLSISLSVFDLFMCTL